MSSMKVCSRCSSPRLMFVSGKCNDLCYVELDGLKHDGYVPSKLNIGGGDYINFRVCVNCGQMQDKWPIPVQTTSLDDDDDIEPVQASPSLSSFQHMTFSEAARQPRIFMTLNVLK